MLALQSAHLRSGTVLVPQDFFRLEYHVLCV